MDEAFVGTELKYLVNIESEGFSLVDDIFEIILKRGSVVMTFTKDDLVFRDGNYYLCFDSEPFGAGTVSAVARAYVPDADFHDGKRTEVLRVDLVKLRTP